MAGSSNEPTTELLMKFHQKGGDALSAECRIELSSDDKLAFKPQPGMLPGFQNGKFFLVTKFSFSAQLRDAEAAAAKKQHQQALVAHAAIHGASGGGTGGKAPPPPTAPPGKPEFDRWRSAKDESWQKTGAYPSNIDSVSFTRLIDQASPVMFKHCVDKVSFVGASLIKRKASMNADGNFVGMSYLRIEFMDVLITSLDWNDGDIIEESCKFTCAKMRILYAQQSQAGVLGEAVPVEWTRPMAIPGQT